MTSTSEGVWGITVRNPASIDSLTSSIQCASSMTKTAGSVRASDAALTSAVNRRRRASGSIFGSSTSGSAMPSRSCEKQQVLGVCVGNAVAHSIASTLPIKPLDAGGRAQQPCHGMEGDLAGV